MHTPSKPGLWPILTALTALLLTACTTVDDFRRYTPDRRAQLVCERDLGIRAQDQRLAEWQGLHAQTQQALDRGYHVHRQCREEPTAATEVCETEGKRRVCQTREAKPRQVCEETPVPLNVPLEKEKLAAYAQNINRQAQERQQSWQACTTRVRALSPEAAFDLF